jgi:hypothetical protein
MRDYRIVRIPENEMEDMVRAAPDKIEEGLRFVDHQIPADNGRLDVLLVDAQGALVVAELKVVEDDAMLIQAVDYYDYVKRNLSALALAYKKHGISTGQEPRIFLIAPSFSAATLCRVKYLAIPINLFTFRCLELAEPAGDRLPVFTQVLSPSSPPPPPQEVPTLEDHFEYIRDDALRALARRFVSQVQALDPSAVHVEPTQSYISIKVANRLLAAMYAKRQGFYIGVYDAEQEWGWNSVNSEGDLPSIWPMVKARFDILKGKRE